MRSRESNPIESSREIAYMQEGQCGNQEAHAEFFGRRCRAVHAIATKANFTQRLISR